MPGLKHIKTPACFGSHGYFIILLSLYIIAIPATGQDYTDKYRIEYWDAGKGLSLGFKNSAIEDANGFLWITSPLGINKFDGGHFEVYHPETSGSAKHNSSYSFSLVEDSAHKIWIGTNKGLLVHNISSDSFTSIYPQIRSYATITTIIPFASSSNEVFCIESANKIVSYNASSFEKKLIATISGDLTLKNSLMMQSAVFDQARNKIWIVKGDHFDQEDGLISIDVNSGKQKYFKWPCLLPELKHQHWLRSICLDKNRNRIWISSADGLLWYDITTGHIGRAGAIKKLTNNSKFSNALGINIDRNANIWYATNSDGMIIYHPGEDCAEPLFTDTVKQKQVAEANMSIYFDRRDMVWLGYGTKKAMYQLIPYKPAVKELPGELFSNLPVINLVAGEQGTLYMGTPKGTKAWNTRSNTVSDLAKMYAFRVPPNTRLIGNDTLSKKAWFIDTKHRTVTEADLLTGSIQKIVFPGDGDQVTFNIVDNLCRPYQKGILVLSDNNGIYYLEGGKQTAEKIIDLPYHVTNIALTNSDYIFVRLHFTARNLCYRKTASTWKLVPNPIDKINWSSIHFDPGTKTYWVGALQELLQFDADFNFIRRFEKNNGLETLDIVTLSTGKDGSIWFNNGRGQIIHLDPSTGMIAPLTSKDGYTGNEFGWQTPFLQDLSGAVTYAGNKGLVRIQPELIETVSSPDIYIKNILVNGHPYFTNVNPDGIKEIRLPYDHTNISFETGLLDFNGQEYAKVRYRTEGVNNQWQIIDPGQPIQYNQLSPGKYKLILQASETWNNFKGREKVVSMYIEPAFWQTWVFWFLSVSLASLAIYLLARKRVRNKYNRKLEMSIQELQLKEMKQKTVELEQKALELEMKTIRAQMNPHFIFNSLNSVNRFILQNNRNEASGYLTKFSKLIRMILQHSQEQMISLENELDALKLYLELESIRFDNKFEFKISVQPSIDISESKIPPLIIQPYAENAIWHGLMHKESKGRLDIEISAEERCLFISITDDGVGREKAAGLESRQDNHKSMGMKLTQERIRNLGKEKDEAYVHVTDLTNPDGSPAGTEVIIKIPMIYD